MTYTPALTSTVPIGTSVNVVCFSGYSLQGTSFSTCTSSGWNPSTVGTCLQASSSLNTTNPTCLPMTSPTNGQYAYSSSGNGPFISGTTVTLYCYSSYSPSGGSSTATCQNGVWSPISLATCERMAKSVGATQCSFGIGAVLNANLVYSNNNALGPWPQSTTVTAMCQPGYIASGGMTAFCQAGTWTPAVLGTCTTTGISNSIGGVSGLTCPRLSDSLTGTLVYSTLGVGPYPSGSTVSLICNIGTTLSGPASSTCTSGVWSPLPGTCTRAFLRRPPTGKNVTEEETTETVSKVTPKLIVAKSDILHENDISNDDPKEVSSSERCPSPIASAFGEITFSEQSTNHSFEDGTTAALRCNLGYKSSGPSFSTCRKGSFRPILGKCKNGSEDELPGICVPLSPPKNSRIVYIQTGSSLDFEDGTTALLYCEEGFAVTGSATLQCQGGQWEPASGFGMCDNI